MNVDLEWDEDDFVVFWKAIIKKGETEFNIMKEL